MEKYNLINMCITFMEENVYQKLAKAYFFIKN